jgi:uncharacterized protein YdeI (YjbR/CyaY-like superfamily)
MTEPTDLPVKSFATKQAFANWLEKQHTKSSGIWLKTAKKGTAARSITYAEAVDVALCYGWIDGRASRLDDAYYLQRFTPRRASSRWSKINRSKALALIGSGAMRPAGLAEVERAQADGRWDAAYDSPKNVQVPPDLVAALAHNPQARRFFERLDGRNRYAVLYRINDAKKPETRARRIARFVDMLARGETIYPTAPRKRS